ncbi:hypothetical protein [Paraburkholderia fungorum]|jgi:hypothetical protein|uniref:hypothetical protein n=1 Tax=Paraburkholderia fungorum TaxID=134537 RepID=UPI002A4B6D91|nr:hypothetical protein [Escherichia coli]
MNLATYILSNDNRELDCIRSQAMKDMAMICSVKEARDVLKSDPDNMICMDRDFRCWIRKGIRDSAGVMTADDENVVEISIDVFDELSEDMGQAYSSEFFQSST